MRRIADRPAGPPDFDGRSPWRAWIVAAALTVVVAFAFQGSRPLWEPDEGRYANGALSMLESGDWLVPRVDGVVYLDKPPLVYWVTAASMGLFGVDEWAFRLAHALALIVSAALVGALAREIWGPRAGPLSMASYSATLLVVVGAFAVTPDALLATAVVGANYCFWRSLRSDDRRLRLLFNAGLALATTLGVLAKGPAMAIFVAPLLIFAALGPRGGRGPRRLDLVVLPVLAGLLGAGWYLAVGLRHPDAWRYWIDNQVVGRLWADHYHRNSQWWGPLTVYLPALTLGMFPVSAIWLRGAREWWSRRGLGWRSLFPATERGRWLFAVIGVPLLVLCCASSRLPLYVLPLAGSLTVASAGLWARQGFPRFRVIAWTAVVMIALKAISPSFAPAGDDGAALARALDRDGVEAYTPIVAAHVKLHSLGFYGYHRVIWTAGSYPYYESPPTPEDVLWSGEKLIGSDDLVVIGKAGLDRLAAGMDLPCAPFEGPQPDGLRVLHCSLDETADPPRIAHHRRTGVERSHTAF